MKVVKYYCDCCNKEYAEDELITYGPVMNIMHYEIDERLTMYNVDVCVECLYKLSSVFHDIRSDK